MTFLIVMVLHLIFYRKLQMWAFPSGINLEQLVILPGYTVLKNVVCSDVFVYCYTDNLCLDSSIIHAYFIYLMDRVTPLSEIRQQLCR